MTNRITKDNLFKPPKSRSETKSDLTSNAAREILEAETAKRTEKTARLRAVRLARSGENA